MDHGDGWQTIYYHLSGISVSEGQVVSRGYFLGNTGTVTACQGGVANGSHVHFSLYYVAPGTNCPTFSLYSPSCQVDWGNYAGQQIQIDDNVVSDGSAQYYGCLTSTITSQSFCSQGAPNWVIGGPIFNSGWIVLTSNNFSFSVPPGYGGSLSGPSVPLSGSFRWEIRVTGSAGNYSSTTWTGSLNLAQDTYQTTIYLVSVGCCGTQFQFYGKVCGQIYGCAQLNWPQAGGIITLANDNYTAWSHVTV